MANKILLLVQRVTVPTGVGQVYGPDDRVLTRAEVEGLAALYWPANEVQHAADVSNCESGGYHTGAWATTGEDSRGLWQINVDAWPQLGQYNLFDPQINAFWAHWIWAQSSPHWGPWTCAHILGIV